VSSTCESCLAAIPVGDRVHLCQVCSRHFGPCCDTWRVAAPHGGWRCAEALIDYLADRGHARLRDDEWSWCTIEIACLACATDPSAPSRPPDPLADFAANCDAASQALADEVAAAALLAHARAESRSTPPMETHMPGSPSRPPYVGQIVHFRVVADDDPQAAIVLRVHETLLDDAPRLDLHVFGDPWLLHEAHYRMSIAHESVCYPAWSEVLA
jgi:hypothetical protein